MTSPYHKNLRKMKDRLGGQTDLPKEKIQKQIEKKQ